MALIRAESPDRRLNWPSVRNGGDMLLLPVQASTVHQALYISEIELFNASTMD